MPAAKRFAPLLLSALLATGLAGAQASDNPLLTVSPLPLRYPQFDKLRDEHFAPALDRGMAEQLAEIQAIADNPAAPTFDNTIVAWEKSGRLLARANTLLSSLGGADTNPARQQLQSDYAAKLAAQRDAVLLNPKLFARVEALYAARDKAAPNAEAKRLIERYRRDMVRAGAQLNDEQKARMKAINAELATLGARFSRAVLAEVNDSAIVVDSAEELAGLSAAQIAAAADAAKKRGLEGKYLLTLLNTTIQPLETELQNRALRERLHRASVARGSRGNANDTTAIVARVMTLRQERAALLGYATPADFVLEDETAKTPAAATALLRQLAPAAVAAAKQEAAELQKLIDADQAAKGQPTFALQPWDWSYYAEKLRAAKYGFDEAQLKPYLEITSVLERGVFFAAQQLYGITFKRRADLPVYRDDVRVYDVFDTDGKQLSIFIADLYARPSKRGGAWANSYVSQNPLEGTLPVSANHLNIPKPPAGQPTLLTWDEVETLFHEFGHALHAIFNKSRYPSLARTPRDFVEYPSQVNEVWADTPSVLASYARHHQTGEPMPRELLDKVSRAKRFNQGYKTLSYLGSAILDQRLHQLKPGEMPAADGMMAFEAKVLKEEGVDFAPVPPRYRTPYFSHIMGGYSAGYYAYIWSEVLDSNTVEWLKANGDLKRANGDQLRAKLLSRGGSEDAMVLFRNLVGHEPRIEPLLERRGLVVQKP
ncbi:M3 family metallopeptidase [Roseateles asaccharophilus]|uniref:Peptidyl-dipeptidase Dcp n=1 Tax=Roseateles asaccharophilus TaxID=582607 RepID=A0ABU2A1M7_9BURK|nr:M3 family metallopeptidase [Roseateles asaccharophilus]MDR7331101.1 peptidyl-dipeptidase Dcp [Roseateles asaccharophilus]